MQKEIKLSFLIKSLGLTTVSENWVQHYTAHKKATCKTQSMQNLFEYLSYSKYTNM